MKQPIAIAAMSITILLTAFAPVFAATPEKTVATTINGMIAAADEKNIATLGEFSTDDAVIRSAILKKQLNKADDLAATAKRWATEKNTLRNIAVEREPLKVTVNGNPATVSHRIKVTVTGPDMRQPWHATSATEHNLRLENGAWKIYIDKTIQQ
jgi:ketosteroid isomerase-like protein